MTDRYKDEVRAFRVDAGPKFTQIAEIPIGTTDLERTNPRDLDLSADGKTLYVANTFGHSIAVIDVTNDANTLTKVLNVGGLSTDVKISGKWGIVCGQETNSLLNGPETGHGLPTLDANGMAIKNTGEPLGYTPVMSDATKATTSAASLTSSTPRRTSSSSATSIKAATFRNLLFPAKSWTYRTTPRRSA